MRRTITLPTVAELRDWLCVKDGKCFWLKGRRVSLEAGCARKDGRVVIRIGGRGGPLLLRSRIIWALIHGEWPALEIDHKNCDQSDDRLENLREATGAQNLRNTRIRRDNRSGFKGVFYHSVLPKWCAQIVIAGRSTHLGLFETPEAAHLAYKKAAERVAGEFARW